jgi:hypothetical protein
MTSKVLVEIIKNNVINILQNCDEGDVILFMRHLTDISCVFVQSSYLSTREGPCVDKDD